jgi:hypothetical protein
MGHHPGSVDRTNVVTITPAITRAYWVQQRAWNGDEVQLVVETKWVPDGTELELTIRGLGGELVEELSKGMSIENGRCVVGHKLVWKHEHVKALPRDAVEPEFRFVATIPRFAIERASNELYVDLVGYAVSG